MVRALKGLYALASGLPLPDYYRTLLWSRSLGRPRGDMKAWPYWRGAELSLLGLRGYAASFPEAESYSFVELGVWTGDSLELLADVRDVLTRRLGITKPIVV